MGDNQGGPGARENTRVRNMSKITVEKLKNEEDYERRDTVIRVMQPENVENNPDNPQKPQEESK